MSDHDDSWNPADGPPPTEEELAEARALAHAIGSSTRKKDPESEVDALVEVAHRIRATAHPDNERARHVAAAAVEEAISRAESRWMRRRWGWVAALAVGIVGVAGVQLAQFRTVRDDSTNFSRPATDVFGAPLPNDARSMPIGRITDARMRSYRDVLLHVRDGRR